MTTETIADSRISEDEIREEHPSVGDVRGVRVFWAVELVKGKQARESLAPYGPTADTLEHGSD